MKKTINRFEKDDQSKRYNSNHPRTTTELIMSDTNFHIIEKSRKRIDLIDVDWENDVLSDDGKLISIFRKVADSDYFTLEIVLPEAEIHEDEEEEEEEENLESENAWNDLGVDTLLNDHNFMLNSATGSNSNTQSAQALPHVFLPHN